MGGYVVHVPVWDKPNDPSKSIDEVLGRKDFALQERDLDIIEFLLKHPWAITSQLGRMFYSASKKPEFNASRRLKTLYEVGLLWRTRPFIPKGHGTHQYIYCLTRLAYNLVIQMRKDDDLEEISFQEYDNIVEISQISHELELNELGISLMKEAEARELDFNWIGTRQARHKVVPKNPGQKAYVVAPDAVIRIGDIIYHIEYERRCNRDNFYAKCMRWKRYRSDRAWKELYPKEPVILIVGFKNPGEIVGHNRRYQSIDQLLSIARSVNMENIYYIYNEDWDQGKWIINSLSKRSRDIFDQTEIKKPGWYEVDEKI